MESSKRIIQAQEIQTGDVLLCVLQGRMAEKVEINTCSKYTHAGICYSEDEIVDMTIEGIQKNKISEFIADAEYVAVFRNPYIWGGDRIEKLRQFLDAAITQGVKYDKRGVYTFTDRKAEHQWNVHEKILEYFENGLQPDDHKKQKYVCSELIVASFIEIGAIDTSASVFYKPDTYSAGDLSRDPTFGHFVGYLTSEKNNPIPDDDEFARGFTFYELIEAAKGMVSRPELQQ